MAPSIKRTPRETMIRQIMVRLGDGVVDVELSSEQLEFAMENALDRYRQRSSNSTEEAFLVLDVQPDVQTYTLPDSVRGVFDIYRRNMGSNGSGNEIDPFALSFTSNIYMAVNPGGLGGGAAGTLATYEFGMAYQKLIGRMFGSEISFTYNPQTKMLFMERKFTGTETVLLKIENERADDELLQDVYAKNWLRDYATAECKMILGTSRAKMPIGGPQGQIQLDGEQLKAEAKAEFDRLEEEIKTGVDGSCGYGFVIG